jgi:hypothetical protein
MGVVSVQSLEIVAAGSALGKVLDEGQAKAQGDSMATDSIAHD